MKTITPTLMEKILIDGEDLNIIRPTPFTTKQIDIKLEWDDTSGVGKLKVIQGHQLINDISLLTGSISNNILILDKAIAKLLKGEVLEMIIECRDGSKFRYDLKDIKYTIKDNCILDIKTLSLCTRHEIV